VREREREKERGWKKVQERGKGRKESEPENYMRRLKRRDKQRYRKIGQGSIVATTAYRNLSYQKF
jgi:hypothetical protein